MVVDVNVGQREYSGLRESGGSGQRGSWKEGRPSGMFGSEGNGLGGRVVGRAFPVQKGKSKRELEAKVALRRVIIVCGKCILFGGFESQQPVIYFCI